MLLNEQMKWLEKNIADCKPIPADENPKFDNDLNFQQYVVNHAVSEEEIETHTTNKDKKYCEKSYLDEIGIPHIKAEPTQKEKAFCDKYRNGKLFNKSDLKKIISIDDNISNGYEYVWQSFYDNTDQHQTYYVLVKIKKE